MEGCQILFQDDGSLGSREFKGRNAGRPEGPPAQPVHNVAFHVFSETVKPCSPLSPPPEPRWLVKAVPGAWLSSVTETQMPASVFCLAADSWEGACDHGPWGHHNFLGERALVCSPPPTPVIPSFLWSLLHILPSHRPHTLASCRSLTRPLKFS